MGDIQKHTGELRNSEYPQYAGLVYYGKSRYFKIYISETEAVLIENSPSMTVKDMWAIYKNHMESIEKIVGKSATK